METRIKISQPTAEKKLHATDVKFIIIHYTAGDWERTKDVFEHPAEFGDVSIHFVIDQSGTVDELIDTLNGVTYQANHCGISWFILNEELFSSFNRFSIGVELVNVNGNLFGYTQEQMHALKNLINKLQVLYPNLRQPTSILGHDQIAGFRGKVDPGILFDWKFIYDNCYQGYPNYESNDAVSVPSDILAQIGQYAEKAQAREFSGINKIKFWHDVSALMESMTALTLSGTTPQESRLIIDKILSRHFSIN